MHWIKKSFYGFFGALFIFIFASFMSTAGLPIFADSFMSVAGFGLLLAIGIIEVNFLTYS